MRAEYIPLSDEDWLEFYLSRQVGHGLDGFEGMAYQRGHGLGSFFKGLFRLILPVAKTVGKTFGSEALSAGANIAGDLVRGRSAKEAFEDHGRTAAANLMDKTASHIRQRGHGYLGKRKLNTGDRTIQLKLTKSQEQTNF